MNNAWNLFGESFSAGFSNGKTVDWEKEYRRLGAVYAHWGAIFAIFGAPINILSESQHHFADRDTWLFFRLMPSVIITICYLLFRKYKFSHEIIMLVIAYTLFIDHAYWPDCGNTDVFLYGQMTLFIPAAFITLLRPYFFVINFVIHFAISAIMYHLCCNQSWWSFFQLKEFIPIIIAGVSCYSVAIFRYYLIKRNFIFSLLLKDALESAEIGRKKSDELLRNILPEEVAEELKEKGKAEAKSFDSVTVMFTDFKDFTSISEKLSPAQLVEEIDYCFREFDKIITKYGLEKIKTIGDSYMCAGGLPVANDTHAQDIVLAAFEIQDFVIAHSAERKAQGSDPFEIRIGVHTGPVVAGIVGTVKFAYDIWGDTVNTASRMESSGEIRKINISETTYSLLKDKFNCTFRGKIQAKNKGEISMYFVEKKQ